MKRAIVLLIALATWLFPIKVASAELTYVNHESEVNKTLEVKEPSDESTTLPQLQVRAVPLQVQPAKTASYTGRHYSKEEVIQLIISYSEQYDINPEVPLCIAKLESGYNQFAKNKNSSASGVFQYLNGTWKGTDEGRTGTLVFDANANVKAAIKYMASRRSTKPWEVRHKCPSNL